MIPTCTEISAVATWDAAGILDALKTHFDTSVLWTVDAFAEGEGLTIGCVADGFQINWRRRNATDIRTSIDPDGSITDPGDSTPTAPTGTGADWSGESTQTVVTNGLWDVTDSITGSIGAGSSVWVAEHDDAVFLFITNTTVTVASNGCYAGRIYTPVLSSLAPSVGQDGLGFVEGRFYDGSGIWYTIARPGLIHWETGVWFETTFHGSSMADGGLGNTALAAEDGTHGTTFAPPAPVPCCVVMDAGSTRYPLVGLYRHLRLAGSTEAALVVHPDPDSNQGWIHIFAQTLAHAWVWAWDKTVSP